MMRILSLFKKKPKKTLKRLYIPEDKIEEFYTFYDKSMDMLGKFKLYKFIEQILPEIEGKHFWIDIWGSSGIRKPYIEYEISEDFSAGPHIIEQGYRPTNTIDTSKPPAGRSVVPSFNPGINEKS